MCVSHIIHLTVVVTRQDHIHQPHVGARRKLRGSEVVKIQSFTPRRSVQIHSLFYFLCPSSRQTPQQLTRRLRVNLLHCCRAGAPAEPGQWPTLGPDLRFKAVHPLQRPGCLGSSSGSWCINPSCSAVTSSGETETLTGWSALRQLYPYYLINTLLTFDI